MWPGQRGTLWVGGLLEKSCYTWLLSPSPTSDPPHCSALHGPNAWLSVPVRGLGPVEGRGSDMLLFKDGYMNVSYTRKRSSKDCLMCVMFTGYLILQVLWNHLRQRLWWAVFTSGSDTSLEECLSLASRVFVVWWRSWEDEEICQLSCDSDWEQLNKNNKSCFNEAELTKLIISVSSSVDQPLFMIFSSDCREVDRNQSPVVDDCDAGLHPSSLLNLVPAAELMGVNE